MIEEFEYKGIWWLPDRPKEQIAGILRFTPNEGAILDLIGSFKDIKDMSKVFEPEFILGISTNGENITLHKCLEIKSSFSIPGIPTSSFHANLVFIGAHFHRLEDIKFKSMSVHYLHLEEWANISGFDENLWDKEGVLTVRYKSPEPFQANISDELKISIKSQATEMSLSVAPKQATIKEKTEIKVETSEDKPFEDYRKIMAHIQNFLTLAVTELVHPTAIQGITSLNEEMMNNKTHYPPVKIVYRLPDIPKPPKTLLESDMLFTFGDISDRFEVFLKKWFEKADLLQPVYDLYFGTLYNPHMYLEHRFLSLIQAIESLHRRIHGGQYLPNEEYKDVYNALLSAIPDRVPTELKERLKEYLKYGNELSLRQRLKGVFDKYHETLNAFIEDKKAFIQKVVDTRNYLTHYDEDLEERAASGADLYHLTQKLKLLLEICLLTELGFSSAEIKGLFSRNRRYQHESI